MIHWLVSRALGGIPGGRDNRGAEPVVADATPAQHGLQRRSERHEVEAEMLHLEDHHVEIRVSVGLGLLPAPIRYGRRRHHHLSRRQLLDHLVQASLTHLCFPPNQ